MSQDDGGVLPVTGSTALIIGGVAVSTQHLWLIAAGGAAIIVGMGLLRIGRARRADRATLKG